MAGLFIYRLGKSGMFCNLNHYVHACALAEQREWRIWPKWQGGLYSAPGKDAWPQFFVREEQEGQIVKRGDRSMELLRKPKVAIVAPRGAVLPKEYREKYKCPDVLMPPTDPWHAHVLIKEHIQLRQDIVMLIDMFYREHLEGHHVIGLHLRGPLRFHGGAIYFSDQLGVGHPSYPAYFARVEKHLTENSVILLATDAGEVIDKVNRRYGTRVVCASEFTPAKGEPHLAKKFNPYILGVDIIKDAWLLAKSDVFVHGNSNVTNFVRCLNPDMPAEDIYGHLYQLAED